MKTNIKTSIKTNVITKAGVAGTLAVLLAFSPLACQMTNAGENGLLEPSRMSAAILPEAVTITTSPAVRILTIETQNGIDALQGHRANPATAVFVSGGQGHLNGVPMENNFTLVFAAGEHTVSVTDEFFGSETKTFTRKAVSVTEPTKAYTPMRCADEIKALQAQYPSLIHTGSIGKSVMGLDIPYFTLGKGERKILFVGSVHAREHMTTAYLMKMADAYAMAYHKREKIDGFDVRSILDQVTFFIVPMLNPDGVSLVTEGYQVISRDEVEKRAGKITETERATWKENINRVNLNRNFPFYWSNKLKPVEGTPLIAGKSEASEPETKALIAFCKKHEFAFALACHSKGQVLYWRDKINGTVPGDERLAKLIQGNTGYVPQKQTTAANMYSGGFENWFRWAFKRPAICVEFTPHNNSSFPHSNADFDKLIWQKADSLGLAVAGF